MSPKAYIEFDVIMAPVRHFDALTQACAGLGPDFNNANAQGAQVATHRTIRETALYGFGEGDPFLAAVESSTIVINGASLTTPNPTLYSRAFIRANLDTNAAQEVYSQCGGCFDAYDSVGGKCFSQGVTTDQVGVKQTRSFGYSVSGDSGVQKRCKNLYNQTVSVIPAATAYKGRAARDGGYRVIRVRWPVTAGGVLNPWVGQHVPKHSPAAGAPYGLANMNSCTLSILCSNLLQTVIRDYSGQRTLAGAANMGQGGLAGAQTMEIDTESVKLVARYYRLAASREVPASFSMKIFRPMISLGPAMPTAADPNQGIGILADAHAANVFNGGELTYVIPSGQDYQTLGASPITQIGQAAHQNFYSVEWNNLSYPMLPSVLLLCAPKSTESFTHKANAHVASAGCRAAQNRDASLSFKRIEITINTSLRQYKYSRDTSCLEDQNILYRDVLANVGRDFFQGDFDAWRRRNNFIILDSSQFCPISQMSPGVISPVQISIRADLMNECVYSDGLNNVVQITAALAATNRSELALAADKIRARPVVVAFFQRSMLSIAPSSASVSVQSYSASTAAEVLAANR
jgi:hypothetical protein